ncbi:hypothetical protein ACK8P5_11735 [Paenibacillus sp. EC2-1]|uniref:hypothetical protein n=1 Tax=Paenibacillus sp. EC2-1 TaxID=3388665 RepID=UPI003BEEC384
MKSGLTPDFILKNQTMVRFSINGAESVAYSNTVDTPWVGPILKFNKFVHEKIVTLNQTITYSFTIQNDGNRDADIILYDTLPKEMSFIPNSLLKDGVPLPGANPNDGVNLGKVYMNSSVFVVFQAILVSIPSSLEVSNMGRADYKFRSLEGRMITGTIHSNSTSITVLPYFVSLIAEVSTNQTFSGDIITYQLLVLNQGHVALASSVIYVPLPSGVTFVPGSVVIDDMHNPTIQPEDGIPLGTIAPGASICIKVNLRIGDSVETNPFPLQGYLQYSVDSEELSVQSNELLVNVIQPLVIIRKSVNKQRATIGCILRYQCDISNDGDFAVDATLKDLLPKHLSLVPGSILMDGNPVHGANLSQGVFLGTIRPDQQVKVTFDAIVEKIKAPPPTSIVAENQASVTFTFRIPDGRLIRQMSLSDKVTVELLAPNFMVTAIPDHYLVGLGELLSFTITVTNTGSLAAEFSLDGWNQDIDVFEKGVVILEGEHEIPLQGCPYPLGILNPEETIQFCYLTKASEAIDEEIEDVTGYFLFTYLTEIDECTYSGEFRSSMINILLDMDNE